MPAPGLLPRQAGPDMGTAVRGLRGGWDLTEQLTLRQACLPHLGALGQPRVPDWAADQAWPFLSSAPMEAPAAWEPSQDWATEQPQPECGSPQPRVNSSWAGRALSWDTT